MANRDCRNSPGSNMVTAPLLLRYTAAVPSASLADLHLQCMLCTWTGKPICLELRNAWTTLRSLRYTMKSRKHIRGCEDRSIIHCGIEFCMAVLRRCSGNTRALSFEADTSRDTRACTTTDPLRCRPHRKEIRGRHTCHRVHATAAAIPHRCTSFGALALLR